MPKKRLLTTCKYYPSPRWSYQILESKMPVTFDSYSYCSYDCLYCLAYHQKSLKSTVSGYTVNEFFRNVAPVSADMQKIERILTGQTKSQFYDYLNQKFIIHWGGLADPFCQFEKKYGAGLEALKIFDKYKQPISFSTKGVWWLDNKKYMDLFKRNPNWQVQFSIVNLDDSVAKRLEKGCPSPSERFRAMRKFKKITGRPATLRLRPFIIGITDKDDQYIEMIHRAKEKKSHRVSIEWYCLESRPAPGMQERFKKLSELAGYDVYKYYKMNSSKKTGYLKLNSNLKLQYIKKINDLCKKLGLAVYYSDSMVKDCSRLNGSQPDFDNKYYFKGNFSYALQLAIKRSEFDLVGKIVQRGKVYFSDIEPYMSTFKKFLWRLAKNHPTIGTVYRSRHWSQTMFSWIQERWNQPNDLRSPYHLFYGQLKPIGIDNDNNVIYQYNQRSII